jgi:hypothetical protein
MADFFPHQNGSLIRINIFDIVTSKVQLAWGHAQKRSGLL